MSRERIDVNEVYPYVNGSATTPTGLSLYEFGGSEKHVRRSHRRFIRYFRSCRLVLDLGCGRGSFMNLLQESGVACVGVDSSPSSLDACKRRGLDAVELADATSYLRRHPDTFEGIFCSHLIEHMEPQQAAALLDSSLLALRPGGVAIFVTPNAADLEVVAGRFWLDTTHVRLYPSELLLSMMRNSGFRNLEVGTFGIVTRQGLMRRVVLSLLLGKHYGHPNAYVIGRKAIG